MIQIYTTRRRRRRCLLLLLRLGLFLIRPRRAFLLTGIITTNTITTTDTILTTVATAAGHRKIAQTGTHATAVVAPVGRLDGQNFRLRRQRGWSLLVVGIAVAASRAGTTTSGATAATAGARRQVVLLLLWLMVVMAVIRMIDTVHRVSSVDGFVVMIRAAKVVVTGWWGRLGGMVRVGGNVVRKNHGGFCIAILRLGPVPVVVQRQRGRVTTQGKVVQVALAGRRLDWRSRTPTGAGDSSRNGQPWRR